MRQSATWVFILSLILCGLAIGTPQQMRVPRPVALTGMEDVVLPSAPVPHGGVHTLDDTIIGSRYFMGRTWNDFQQNGTFGKQIAVDHDGFVQNVWMKGFNAAQTPRHVYYNAFDPSTQTWTGDTSGVQIDASTKAGYTNIAVDAAGFGYPAFHQVLTTNPHSAAAVDFQPHLGAYTTWEIPYLSGEPQIIWPHIDVDMNGNLHTVHTVNAGNGHSYYARGVPNVVTDSIDWGNGFMDLGPTTFVTVDVAAAMHSQRIALAWIFGDSNQVSPYGGDNIYVQVSEDGGLNWGQARNITNFTPVDTNCIRNGGTPEVCDRDTLRPWIDLSMLFDQNDVLHIAFSTEGLYYWFPPDTTMAPGPWTYTDRRSEIWHWSDDHEWWSLMAERWYGPIPGTQTVGTDQLMCHHPSLAVDTITHYLYSSYQLYDTSEYNSTNFLMADAYMTVSTDGGAHWAEGTGVVVTRPAVIPAPPGESMHERDINLAKYVTGGYVHLQYQLDHEAGSSNWEPPATLNEQYYLKVPVDSIPTSPLMPVRALRWDSTGYPRPESVDGSRHLQPGQFTLYQNYPNPFNPTTTIQFDLASRSIVNLKVYDVLGREVATLLNKATMNAGVQVMSFDASHLSSGVYFYRLETPSFSQTRKMVVMK